jgi:hypothetical protein
MYRVVVPTGTTSTETIVLKTAPLPTSNFYFQCQVKDSTGATQAGITSSYAKATGLLTVVGVNDLDVVTIAGSWTTK